MTTGAKISNRTPSIFSTTTNNRDAPCIHLKFVSFARNDSVKSMRFSSRRRRFNRIDEIKAHRRAPDIAFFRAELPLKRLLILKTPNVSTPNIKTPLSDKMRALKFRLFAGFFSAEKTASIEIFRAWKFAAQICREDSIFCFVFSHESDNRKRCWQVFLKFYR